ncbi:putative monovalent cation/H+ antiporter subunit A [Myroides odoratus]|uniref:putative monovalent cation/H+ antiporter subunit A n=1 Tax=Myroides odoratus TaxID=256 RepID=UPI000765D032|nr:putative monovalent cation/H+ antiporter subunit A [Myroides odoratus]
MLFIILLTFVLAFSTLFLKGLGRSKFTGLLTLIPLSLFIYFLSYLPKIQSGKEVMLFRNEWVPSLGIAFDFKLDGLSLLFSLLITGIGTLVYWYASYYLKGHVYIHRFFAYLGLFMGAMLGVVLSDNLISLFVFWELTSITSFFLIGFNNEEEDSRKSALWALGITGLGGFFLLSFAAVMGSIAGSYSIHELLTQSDFLKEHASYGVLLFFLFMGAFTKSAQFPFHFWLPGAMKAPTPVSAYLHSATMVKAGIYLLARFTPILGDHVYWNTTLQIIGGLTMLFGAIHSVFRKDMKGILAYTTISALGLIVFLLGVGSEKAIYAASIFILVHALYKATLFLVTGTVDHQTHTRDINQLGGLRKTMPALAGAALIAALSSAGIPLTFGFIGKEIIYDATYTYPINEWALAFTGAAVLTNIFLTASGFLVGIKPFFGKVKKACQDVPKPSIQMWLPPVILAVLSVVFGVLPQFVNEGVLASVVRAIGGKPIDMELALWHGFNEIVALSGGTILLGTALYFVFKGYKNSLAVVSPFYNLSPQHIFGFVVEKFRLFAYTYTRLFQSGYLRIYLMVIIVFFIGLVGYKLFADVPLRVNTEGLSEFRVYELVVFLITVIAIFFAINTPSRLSAIAATGVVGYCICLIFVFYGAPDLAMTQFAIDTLTVVLFVLVLFKLPGFLKLSNRRIQFRDAVVSIAFGGLISLITLQALVSPADKEISRYYAENAYILAKGKNVVNVILVDFRGFDTLIETIVLSIAALGVYGLLKYRTKDEEISE